MKKHLDNGGVAGLNHDASSFKYNFKIDLENKNLAHTLIVDFVGSNKRVLDVGCATGYLDRVFVERGCIVTGLEIDKVAAEEARQYCIEVVNADVEHLDWDQTFGEKLFDVILFGDVLEHMINPQKVLKAARKFLSPEGYVTASIPNIAHASIRLQLLQGIFQYRPLGLLDETHLRFFTLDSLQAMFDQAGYIIVDMKRVELGPFDTEIHLQPENLPPGIVEHVLRDKESKTYQFICRAHGKNQPIVVSFQLAESQHQLETLGMEIENAKALLIKNEEESARLRDALKSKEVELVETRQRLEMNVETELQLKKSQESLVTLRNELHEKEAELTQTRQQLEMNEVQRKLESLEQSQHEIQRIRDRLESYDLFPTIDIVTVLYNSDRYLASFFNSLSRLEYASSKLTLTVVDNASTGNTKEFVNTLLPALNFPGQYFRLPRNIGFAGGANFGAKIGKAEYVCVVNPDTEFHPDTLQELAAAVRRDPFIAIADARQLPYEHPKYFDPVTGETSWCSGSCLLIRRQLIDKIGLFDPSFFMYCEDVDISWRVWSTGYKCVYAAKACIVHHKNPASYRASLEYYFGVRNGFLMRLIYGSREDLLRYYRGICQELRGGQSDPIYRKYLWKAFFSHIALVPHALRRRWAMPAKRNQWIKFCGWDYGENR